MPGAGDGRWADCSIRSPVAPIGGGAALMSDGASASRAPTPTELRLQILDAGWHPLPVVGKRPILRSWQRHCAEAPLEEEVERWGREWPDAASTGIACGAVVAIDIDVLSDEMLARQLRALA